MTSHVNENQVATASGSHTFSPPVVHSCRRSAGETLLGISFLNIFPYPLQEFGRIQRLKILIARMFLERIMCYIRRLLYEKDVE